MPVHYCFFAAGIALDVVRGGVEMCGCVDVSLGNISNWSVSMVSSSGNLALKRPDGLSVRNAFMQADSVSRRVEVECGRSVCDFLGCDFVGVLPTSSFSVHHNCSSRSMYF